MPGTLSETTEHDRQHETVPTPPAPGSDEQWMLALSQGHREAFDMLFVRYKQPIFAFFYRRVGDAAQAEELSQETWIVLYRSAPKYEHRALFRTYLYAIALKILQSHRRKAALRATFFGEAKHEPSSPNSLDTTLVMRDALSRLDRHEREILMLREFEQLSYTEIAELLQLPVNTVRSRLFRARSALHGILSSPAPSPVNTSLSTVKERA